MARRRVFDFSGDDTVLGDDRSNVLFGGGGDDHIFGFGGRDLIFAGAGDDIVGPGAGDDIIVVGRGDDTVLASADDDVIWAQGDTTLAVDVSAGVDGPTFDDIGRETILGHNSRGAAVETQFVLKGSAEGLLDPDAVLESLSFSETRRGYSLTLENGDVISVHGRVARKIDSLDELIERGFLTFLIESDDGAEQIDGSRADDEILASGGVLVDSGDGDDTIFAETKAGETLTVINSIGRDVVEVSGDGVARGVTRLMIEDDGSVEFTHEECLIWEFEAGESDAAAIVNEIEILTLGDPSEVDLQQQYLETEFQFADRFYSITTSSGAEIEVFGLGVAQGIDSTEALIEQGLLTFRYESDAPGQTILGTIANDVIETSAEGFAIDPGAGDDMLTVRRASSTVELPSGGSIALAGVVKNSEGLDTVSVSEDGEGAVLGVTNLRIDADGAAETEIEECLIWEFGAGEASSIANVFQVDFLAGPPTSGVDLQASLDLVAFSRTDEGYRLEVQGTGLGESAVEARGDAAIGASRKELLEAGLLRMGYTAEVGDQSVLGSRASDAIILTGSTAVRNIAATDGSAGGIFVDGRDGDDAIYLDLTDAPSGALAAIVQNSAGVDVVTVDGEARVRGVTELVLDGDAPLEIEECLIWEFEAGEANTTVVENVLSISAETSGSLDDVVMEEAVLSFVSIERAPGLAGYLIIQDIDGESMIEVGAEGPDLGIASVDDAIEAGVLLLEAKGGDADETIAGSRARDIIGGGGGSDVLTGAEESDVFVFGRGDGADQITDFTTSASKTDADMLDLTGFEADDAKAAIAAATVGRTGLVIDFGEGDVLTLNGVTSIDAEDVLL